MRLAGKTACFLFLIILISPLFAESFPDEDPALEAQAGSDDSESSPSDDWFLFFEELFIFDDAFSFEPQSDQDNDGNSPLAELVPGEEALPGDETLPGDEPLLSEETFSGEEFLPGGETLLTEEIPSDEDTLLAEDTLMDEDYFFFEAPPLIIEAPAFETRSLDEIFPDFSQRQKIIAMSSRGLRNYFVKDESPTIIPNPDAGIDLLGSILKKNPSHLIEALVVVPYNEREFDLLDIYNALGRIEKIKDQPFSFNDNNYYIFTESTRIESNRNRRAVSDPLPALTLPFSETMYLRLKEINFGNLFIRGDISISQYGITYSMTNFTDVRYFLLPIVKAERFATILYLEPVKEGLLIYSISGFYLPGFIADRVNLTPNINRRTEIFINWITEGLRKQESITAEQDS